MNQADRLLLVLQTGVFTTREVALRAGVPLKSAGVVLSSLHQRGEIFKVGIVAQCGYLWSLEPTPHPDWLPVEVGVTMLPVVLPVSCPIRIVDGEVFEVVNDCSGPVTEAWPEGSGSSLSFEYHLGFAL